MKRVFQFPFFLLFILLPACGGNGKTHIQQSELLQLIQTGQPPVIVDVRSESEYETSHVPGAIHIPFWSAFSKNDLNGLPLEDLLVIYCEHGPRAGFARFALSMGGFENMVYLKGHMSAWKQAGLPVETSETKKE